VNYGKNVKSGRGNCFGGVRIDSVTGVSVRGRCSREESTIPKILCTQGESMRGKSPRVKRVSMCEKDTEEKGCEGAKKVEGYQIAVA